MGGLEPNKVWGKSMCLGAKLICLHLTLEYDALFEVVDVGII